MTSTTQLLRMFCALHLISQTARDTLQKIAETYDVEPYLNAENKHFLWEILGWLRENKDFLDDGPAIYTLLKQHLNP